MLTVAEGITSEKLINPLLGIGHGLPARCLRPDICKLAECCREPFNCVGRHFDSSAMVRCSSSFTFASSMPSLFSIS